jgi:hypothetical protein
MIEVREYWLMNGPGAMPMNKEYADSGCTGSDCDVVVGVTVNCKWGDLGANLKGGSSDVLCR